MSATPPLRAGRWHEVGVEGEVPFENGWANVGDSYETVAFRTDPFGNVEFKGALDPSNLTDAAALTLPAAYRPAATRLFSVPAGEADTGTFASASIDSDGVLSVKGSPDLPIALDSVRVAL